MTDKISSHAGHSHAPANFNTAFAIGIGLNTAYVLFEVVFGIIGHHSRYDLPNCRTAAEKTISSATRWKSFNAMQALTHILGITQSYGGPSAFSLIYLWYDVAGAEAPEVGFGGVFPVS